MADVKYYFVDCNYNCAEASLLAISDQYGLGLTVEDTRLVAGFGGGMSCGKTCGALCGCIAAIGKMKVTERAHATEGFREICSGFAGRFEETMGDMNCAVLKPRYFRPEVRCLDLMEKTMELFDSFMEEEGKPNV